MRTHRRNRFDGNKVDYSPAKAASERRLRAIFGNRLNSRIVDNAEVTSINVFLADDAPLGDAEPLASAITGVMETHLLTNNLIFFTPAERDLVQGLRAECKPGRFDAVPPKCVFEIPECPGAMDGVQNIFANTVGLHRA